MAFDRISVNPERMGGLPSIRDTRVAVAAVIGQLAAERTVQQILNDYPYWEKGDIVAALALAAGALRERELPFVAA